MISIINRVLQTAMTTEQKVNLLREFLQVIILRITYDKGYFKHLSFVGGTALRLLYDLRRFSEDLDFSLIEKKAYGLDRLAADLLRELTNYGLQVELTKHSKKTVQSIDIRFENILYDLKLSPLKSQKILIRFEIDSNPPQGWTTDVSLINKVYIFTVTHFDLPSLFALKLHACFYRKYTKGRDFYDLIWYLGKKIKPNYRLLNNAIEQTQRTKASIDDKNFEDFLRKNIERIDFARAKRDVERFLEDKSELRLFDKELILKITS